MKRAPAPPPRHVVRTEVTIAAPARVVWHVLTDLGAYRQWNPFIRSLEGDLSVGKHLRGRMIWAGVREVVFSPRVIALDPEREMSWTSHHIAPLVFHGTHSFHLEENEGRTRLVHSEAFGGWLLRFYWKGLDRNLRQGFAAMNQALRDRGENRAGGSGA